MIGVGGKSAQTVWAEMLTSPLSSCVALDKILTLTVLWFIYL